MNPSNANPPVIQFAPCHAACAAPGTFVLVPLPINGKIEFRPDVTACVPQLFPIVEMKL